MDDRGSSQHVRQTEELFQIAVELPRDRRHAFIDEHCQSDMQLRSELIRLLEHYDAAPHNYLQAAVFSLADSFDRLQRAPERIGEFEIIRLLGRGGMGAVYEAQQSQPRRRVALKVVRFDSAGPDMLRRFRHEAQLLGQLEHPGIARIYEFGVGEVWRDGAAGHSQPFFAMELVRGTPLGEYVAERRLNLHATIELLIRVCSAVQHAHQKGVIHRDLKPANIVVSDDGQPKVLDFGIARAIGADAATVTAQTAPGQLVGTVQYMSPEQLAGDARGADARSDIYSLGVMAYELLARRPPIDVAGLPAPQAIRMLAEQDPRPAGALRAELRGDIQAILAKALERDPERRYGSASEMAADFRRHLNHQPILARPATAMVQFRKFVRRNRLLVGAACVVLCVLIAATSWIAIAMFQAQRASARATAINEFLRDLIASADPATGRADVPLVEVLRQAANDAAARFAESPEFEAEVRTTLGRAFSNLSLFDEALVHIERAHDLRRAALGEADPLTLESASHKADLLKRAQRFADAERCAREVLSLTPPTRMREPYALNARRTVAVVQALRNDFEPAESEFRAVLNDSRAAFGDRHAVTLASTNDLAWFLSSRVIRRLSADPPRDARESADLFRVSLEPHIALHGEQSYATLNLRTNLAHALLMTSDYAAAAEQAEIVLQAAPARFGEDHRFCITARTALIEARFAQHRFDEAATLALANIQSSRRRAAGRESAFLLSDLSDTLHILDAGGRCAEGEQHARELLDAFGGETAHGGSLALRYAIYVARFISRQGRLDEAEERFSRILTAESSDLDLLVFRDLAYGAQQTLRGAYHDAERRLLAAHERMSEPNVLIVAVQQELVRLYDAWQRPDDAAAWRARLDSPAPP